MVKCKKKNSQRRVRDLPSSSSSLPEISRGCQDDEPRCVAKPGSYDERVVLTSDGESRTLRDWTVHFAQLLYPRAGSTTYRVPALYFNHQNLMTPELAAKRNLVVAPALSHSFSSSMSSSSSTSLASSPVLSLAPSPLPQAVPGDTLADQLLLKDAYLLSTPSLKTIQSGAGHDAVPEVAGDGVRRDSGPEAEDATGPELPSSETTCSRCGKLHAFRHQRRRQQQQPLQILFPPQESIQRRDKAMAIVLEALEQRGQRLEDEGGRGLFIISGINYDHYLSRIPQQLRRAWGWSGREDGDRRESGEEGPTLRAGGHLGESLNTRGILDILAVHESAGLLLLQVKAVGGNAEQWTCSEDSMVPVVRSVMDKVRARSKFLRQEVGRELLGARPGRPVVHVLALPFIPRRLYSKTMKDSPEEAGALPGLHVLCQEDFAALSCPPDQRWSAGADPLRDWWTRQFGACDVQLTSDEVQVIVGRICGLFSTVMPLPDTKCRTEVRTYGHCVSEVAARFSGPVLTVQEYELLHCEDRRVALHGPPGNGMALLLALKAAQWLQETPERRDQGRRTREQGSAEHHVVVVSLKGSRRPQDIILTSTVRNLLSEAKDTTCDSERRLHDLLLYFDNLPPSDAQDEIDDRLASFIKEVCKGDAEKQDYELPTTGNNPETKTRALKDSSKDVKDRCTNDEIECTPSVDICDEEINEFTSTGTDQFMNNNYENITMNFSFVMTDVKEPSDLKFQALLCSLLKIPQVNCVWWSSSQALTDQHALSGTFSLQELPHVTRRPPNVQRVMQQLQRREDGHGGYAVDSLDAGLATNGVPVLCVRHGVPEIKGLGRQESMSEDDLDISVHCQTSSDDEKDVDIVHTRRPCPMLQRDRPGDTEECVQSEFPTKSIREAGRLCSSTQKADEITDSLSLVDETQNEPPLKALTQFGTLPNSQLLSHGCKSPFCCNICTQSVSSLIEFLLADSSNPRVSPFLMGTIKLLKDPAKNRFGISIKPRDILIITAMPEQRKKASYLSVNYKSDDCLKKDCALEGESDALIDYEQQWKALMQTTMLEGIRKKIPLRVLNKQSAGKIAFPRNYAVLTDVTLARGLERKVVIYIPWAGHGQETEKEEDFQQFSSLTGKGEQREADAEAMIHTAIRCRKYAVTANFCTDLHGEHHSPVPQSLTLLPTTDPYLGQSSRDFAADDVSDSSWDTLDICDMSSESDDSEGEDSERDLQAQSHLELGLKARPDTRVFLQQNEALSCRVSTKETEAVAASFPKRQSKMELAIKGRQVAHPTDIPGVHSLPLVAHDCAGCGTTNTANVKHQFGTGHDDTSLGDDLGSAKTPSGHDDRISGNPLWSHDDRISVKPLFGHADLLSLPEADRRGLFTAASCCLSQLVIILP